MTHVNEAATTLARQIAVETAGEQDDVGQMLEPIDIGDDVVDIQFVCLRKGYEGWNWSVTLYHDDQLDHWTVNESSIVPTDQALLAPEWIPWKDRLLPSDVSVTDSIGTDPDDERLEAGADGLAADSASRTSSNQSTRNRKVGGARRSSDDRDVDERDARYDAFIMQDHEPDTLHYMNSAQEVSDSIFCDSAMLEVIESLRLGRKHVMTPQARSSTAQRWYKGSHGPKTLSTQTAQGNNCSSCAFYVPLQGQLSTVFGACANQWSPDDGRVVSLDHGCGEHSEIDPPEPSRLWVQSQPAFDDLHIDIVKQSDREESGKVELIEELVVQSQERKQERRRKHNSSRRKS